jgi:hypothetical protein
MLYLAKPDYYRSSAAIEFVDNTSDSGILGQLRVVS